MSHPVLQQTRLRAATWLLLGLFGALSFAAAGCYYYKPVLPTNKCQSNEQCPVGDWCKENRCEDIHFPK